MCDINCAEDNDLYTILKKHGASDAQIAIFIGKITVHLHVLAIQANLRSVAKHLDAAMSACAAKRMN